MNFGSEHISRRTNGAALDCVMDEGHVGDCVPVVHVRAWCILWRMSITRVPVPAARMAASRGSMLRCTEGCQKRMMRKQSSMVDRLDRLASASSAFRLHTWRVRELIGLKRRRYKVVTQNSFALLNKNITVISKSGASGVLMWMMMASLWSMWTRTKHTKRFIEVK